MNKRIIIGTLAFIIGIVLAFYSESFFREIIQDIYKWSTAEKIQFVGKNFFVFSNKLYFLTFGTGLLILTLENLDGEMTQVLKNGIISMLIFGVLLIGISATDANFKIVECTACDDGIRKLRWNEINYSLIIGLSAFISIIPSLIRMIKRRKKLLHSHE